MIKAIAKNRRKEMSWGGGGGGKLQGEMRVKLRVWRDLCKLGELKMLWLTGMKRKEGAD